MLGNSDYWSVTDTQFAYNISLVAYKKIDKSLTNLGCLRWLAHSGSLQKMVLR